MVQLGEHGQHESWDLESGGQVDSGGKKERLSQDGWHSRDIPVGMSVHRSSIRYMKSSFMSLMQGFRQLLTQQQEPLHRSMHRHVHAQAQTHARQCANTNDTQHTKYTELTQDHYRQNFAQTEWFISSVLASAIVCIHVANDKDR